MADVNAPSGQAPEMAPPVRTDDQILPRIRCHLDEQWFVLTKDTLREALHITPINNNQPFVAPPSSDVLINFVNELGYPKLVRNLSNVVTNDMFQSWRALLTIINLCLTRKTFGFERPRAPVLQILWGIIKQVNIDYVERIWEEFVQSIHTFIEDKRNLSWHTPGKKRATLIVILSIWFTKLIIHHLQRRHKFHPRPDSLLHLPNKEPVLGYLKFSAKGTKREVFGMPIPDSLIIAEIHEASYYREYLAKVAQHQRYLASETGSNLVSPAPKPTKPARKPKTTVPKAPPRPAAEDVPAMEPRVAAEDTDLQKALEESMKSAYALPRGPLLPVVIKEPESGKYQPLPEVPGKGKAKVTEEQVAHDLLSLQKHKKISPADQYIFQRRVSEPTGSSGHDESPYALLGQSDSEEESEKVVLGADEGGQDEGQAGPDPGQAGLDPGDAGAKVQSIPSPVVHAGSDREHMDLDVADVSPQPSMEQLDEGFTAMVYSKVQENLKLAVEEHVLLEEPASSSGTLSSLQHLSKDISFGDQFFSKKSSDADKITEIEVELMVHQQFKATTTDTTTTTTTLPPPQAQQQSTAEAMMVKRIEADMKEILHQRMWETESYKSHEDHMQLFEALEKSMNHDHSDELMQDLAEARKKRKKSRESPKTPHGSPSHQPPPPPPPVGPSGPSGAPGASESSQVPPPPPPPPSSTSQESPSKGSAAPSPSKTAASVEYQAWTMTDIRLRPSISLTRADLEMDKDMAPDKQTQLSNDEDIGSVHIPTVNLRQGWWKPFEEERPVTPEPAWSIRSSDVPVPTNNWASALVSNYSPPPEDSLLAQTSDIATFMDWFCKRRGITELKPQDLEGPAYEIVKVFHPDVIHLQYQIEECHKLQTDSVDDPILRHNVSKPLPLGGPPGQVTIQSNFFFNKDLEYQRYDSTGRRLALSISKIKAAYYPDTGLEQMVPDQFWINEECKYDIAAMYDISHCDFEDLYLLNLQGHLNHLPSKDKKNLTTAVNQWTRQLVIRQRVEDFQLVIESYQTQLNPTKPQWDATGFEYKHDYTIIDSPRAVIFRDKYRVQMMMRFNEIHKFSDGTLQQIDEALDYRVKEFRINRMNPVGFFNSLVHSFRALSALRRFGLRTASTATKPCQGDSSEFYLITGIIYTDQRGTMVLATLFNGSEQRHFRSFITNINLQESRRLQLLAKRMSIHNSMLTPQTHYQ
uniref:E-beta-farnesene synthase n=1 Tax=Tanacetum cinerariifolium TaxID=118510 RepID=A0A6L2KJS4_TANCI|nr:E-beta-farnesene synthase [Tanacetum cinerariifolium]